MNTNTPVALEVLLADGTSKRYKFHQALPRNARPVGVVYEDGATWHCPEPVAIPQHPTSDELNALIDKLVRSNRTSSYHEASGLTRIASSLREEAFSAAKAAVPSDFVGSLSRMGGTRILPYVPPWTAVGYIANIDELAIPTAAKITIVKDLPGWARTLLVVGYEAGNLRSEAQSQWFEAVRILDSRRDTTS